MGKLVVAEEKLKSLLAGTVTSSEAVRVGILAGKSIESKDIIALAVPTPLLSELGDTGGSDRRDGNASASELNEWWVLDFASQVRGVLPGGVDVLGISLACATPSLSSFLPRLAKLLRDLSVQSTHLAGSNDGSSDSGCGSDLGYQQLLLLHFCVASRKFKCHRLDTTDNQAGFRQADLKFRDQLDPWIKLQTTLAINACYYAPATPPERPHPQHKSKKEETDDSQLANRILQIGLVPLMDRLRRAVVTIRGRAIANEADPLIKRGKKAQPPSSQEVVSMELLLRHPDVEGSTPPTFVGGARRVNLKGNLVLSAYVHWKATCADAIEAIRSDACRSMSTRLQTMLDELSPLGGVISEPLPVRVNISTPMCRQFMLTDYLLPGDSVQDGCDRVKELLSMAEDGIEAVLLEQLAPKDSAPSLTRRSKKVVEEKGSSDFTTVWGVYTGLVGVLAAVGAVLLAIAIWIAMQPT